jgi:hypothetical protein
MKMGCGGIEAVMAIAQHGTQSRIENRPDQFPFDRGKRPQYVIGHGLGTFRPPYAKPQPGKIPGAEMRSHGLEPVMPGKPP